MENLVSGALRAEAELISEMKHKQEISMPVFYRGKAGILPGGREGRGAVICSSRLFHHEIRAFPTLRLIWQACIRPVLLPCRGRYAV